METKKFNIIHCQGKSALSNYKSFLQMDTLDIPELTVLFVASDMSKVTFTLSDNYINAYQDTEKKFNNTQKIEMLYNALLNVKTKYCIILDAYDVFIYFKEGLLEKFLEFNTKILFNASLNNYPECVIEELPNRESLGKAKYFNAGCCIGYTDSLIKFYKECLDILKLNLYNPGNSEQLILRNAYKKYCTCENKDNKFIKIDNESKIFLTTGQRLLLYENGKINIYTNCR